MTISEMHIAFKIGLDKVDSLNYANILPEEIDFFLNKAQESFIKQRYSGDNIKRRSFEETQKRTEDLKNIVVNAVLSPIANAVDNINTSARFVILPDGTFPLLNPYPKHWIIIQELTGISYEGCNGSTITDRVYTEAIQHNDYSKLINNPFGKPNDGKVLRLMENGRVELIPATNVTITDYHLRYIKEPVQVDIVTSTNCELSSMVHNEIVNEAVLMTLEDIESKRIQTFIPIVQNKQE